MDFEINHDLQMIHELVFRRAYKYAPAHHPLYIVHQAKTTSTPLDSRWRLVVEKGVVTDDTRLELQTLTSGWTWSECVQYNGLRGTLGESSWKFDHAPMTPSFYIFEERENVIGGMTVILSRSTEYTPPSEKFGTLFDNDKIGRPTAFDLNEYQKSHSDRIYGKCLKWDQEMDINLVVPPTDEWRGEVLKTIQACEVINVHLIAGNLIFI